MAKPTPNRPRSTPPSGVKEWHLFISKNGRKWDILQYHGYGNMLSMAVHKITMENYKRVEVRRKNFKPFDIVMTMHRIMISHDFSENINILHRELDIQFNAHFDPVNNSEYKNLISPSEALNEKPAII